MIQTDKARNLICPEHSNNRGIVAYEDRSRQKEISRHTPSKISTGKCLLVVMALVHEWEMITWTSSSRGLMGVNIHYMTLIHSGDARTGTVGCYTVRSCLSREKILHCRKAK